MNRRDFVRFNNYYNKKITLDELKYITAENISAATLNVTSDKMYAEASEYNTHMIEMQKKREIYLHDFWTSLIFNAIISILIIIDTLTFDIFDFLPTEQLSLFYNIFHSVPWCNLPVIVLFGIFIFVVFIRKNYELKYPIGILLFAIPFNICSLVMIFANILLLRPLKKHHDAIKGDAGYPYFVPLNLTFFNEEALENAQKTVTDYSFDDYKISPDTDMGIPEL